MLRQVASRYMTSTHERLGQIQGTEFQSVPERDTHRRAGLGRVPGRRSGASELALNSFRIYLSRMDDTSANVHSTDESHHRAGLGRVPGPGKTNVNLYRILRKYTAPAPSRPAARGPRDARCPILRPSTKQGQPSTDNLSRGPPDPNPVTIHQSRKAR